MNFIFYVQGSSVEPYKIECDSEKGVMSCTCQAGLKKQICKHRLGLLKGESKGLQSGLEGALDAFLENVKDSKLFNNFIEYQKLEFESELLQQKLKVVKSELAKIMKG
ncbi:hypothetical protein [Cellvibrio sp. pealriver]|uniref:hypothetical protein n=1 Tax=Cellvibrio sp. pealriver TaxID=1622269 RepID=UPI00066FFDE1|nr:hypothetical protein [Cellvibrio sp. pealriver]